MAASKAPTAELLELARRGTTEESVDRLLKDHLPKWRRKPKDPTEVLNALAERGYATTAWHVLKTMNRNKVPVNTFHLNVAIKAARRAKDWQMAFQLLASAAGAKVVPDRISFNSVISACNAQSAWSGGLSLLGEMEAASIAPNEITYSTAISICDETAWAVAQQLLTEMLEERLQPHVPAFNAAITCCGAARHWERANLLLRRMKEVMAQADVISYNSAISACEKASEWQAALATLFGMGTSSTMPDTISFNTALSACEEAGQWQDALQLFHSMRTMPDIISVNTMLSAFARAGEWSQALLLFQSVSCLSLAADLYTFNSMISACAKAGLWRMTLQLMEDMAIARVRSSVVSCNSAIMACDKAGQWERALDFFISLPRRQLRPDQMSCHALTSACSQASQWQSALFFATSRPSVVGISAAITACSRGSHWQRALHLFHAMPSMVLQADVVAYGAAIIACRDWPQALDLLEKMGEVLQPNEVCMSATIAVVASSHGPWAVAVELIETAKGQLLASEAGYGAAIQACNSSAQWECALQFLADMERQNLKTASSATAAMLVCSRARRWQEVLVLATQQHLSSMDAVDQSTALGIALMECEQRGAMGSERQLLRSLTAVAPGARVALQSSALLRRRGAGPLRGILLQLADAKREMLPYHQAVAMLKYVIEKAKAFDPESILLALDNFGEDLGWAKFAGGSKGATMAAALRGGLPPSTQHLGVLEIGTYWGTSCLRLAHVLGNVPITTLELDPVHVAVARVLLALGGVAVKVCTGHSQLLLPRFRGAFAAVLVDSWGSEYEENLELLHRHNLLTPTGAVLVADNVLSTAAVGLLWRTGRGQMPDGDSRPYTSQLVAVQEVVDKSEDWVSVSVGGAKGVAVAPLPERLAELQRRSSFLREMVVGTKGREVAEVEMPRLCQEARDILQMAVVRPPDTSQLQGKPVAD